MLKNKFDITHMPLNEIEDIREDGVSEDIMIEDLDDESPHVNRKECNRKKSKKKSFILMAVLLLMTIASATGCVLLLNENRKLVKETQLEDTIEAVSDAVLFTQEEMDDYASSVSVEAVEASKEELLNTIKTIVDNDGVLTMLRNIFPEYLVILANSKYNFIPVDKTLATHNLVEAQFQMTEDGIVEYYNETGEKISHTGVDVSRFQGTIDWKKVAEDDIEFAIIRLGLRGYGTGEIFLDANYEANITGAIDAGIDVGVYFYSQAINEEEAMQEANFVIENLSQYDIQLPVVMDIEYADSSDGRANALTIEERTHLAVIFCDALKEAGYDTMIYGNMRTFLMMLDLSQLTEYSKWFAYYNLPLYYPYEFQILQYSESGTVDGIKEKVDMNVLIGDYPW